MEDTPQRRKVLSQDCWEAGMTTLKANQAVIALVSVVLVKISHGSYRAEVGPLIRCHCASPIPRPL